MFYFLSTHDTSATGVWCLIPSKNDVEQAELQLLPGWTALPFVKNFTRLAGQKSLLKFTFLLHYLIEFMKLRRRKREEEEHPDAEEALNLEMETFKKIQDEKLVK